MILVDTSIWADHLRAPVTELQGHLSDGSVLMHPYVLGEISLGDMPLYDFTLRGFQKFPKAVIATDENVLRLIRERKLNGSGIGYVDAHLLTSAMLTPDTTLWTRDKRLHRVALEMGVAYEAQVDP